MKTVIEEGRKRHSDRERLPTVNHPDALAAAVARRPEAKPTPQESKTYRRKAERTHVWQGYVLILLNLTTIGLLIYLSFVA